jgi:hypothetical protein
MNRVALILILFAFGFQTWGQLIVKPIDRSSGNKKVTAARQNALSLPFWDDFSLSGPAPDTSLWQYGADVFVNNSLGINPPTINVATFDGARANGSPHNSSSEEPGAADSLVSCPVNLGAIPEDLSSTVILSFQYQIQGAGEIPEENDSISLFFLDSSNIWHQVWNVQGGEVFNFTNFVPVNLTVEDFHRDTIYFLHDQFQFKFVSFSSRKGIFDTWHIDYIYLNSKRELTHSILDRSISSEPGPLFGPYYHFPMPQYQANRLFTQQEVVFSNLDIARPHPVEFRHSFIDRINGSVLLAEDIIDTPLQAGEFDLSTGIAEVDSLTFLGDSLFIISEFIYKSGDDTLFAEQDVVVMDGIPVLVLEDPQGIDLKLNDTLRVDYSLHETMAYDDGTAEFAAGINLDGGQVAVRYALFTPDTLTHLQVYFPPFATSTGQAITLKVWSRLSDAGLRAQQQFTIEASDQLNNFAEIQLNVPLVVSDTFFVGFEQFTDDYIGIGLDRSNPLASDDLFFNVSQEWQQNQEIVGALMIRPVFQNTSDLVLHTPASEVSERISLYPNPANNELHSTKHFDQLQIFNLGGKLIFTSEYHPNINIQEIPNGIYLVKIISKDTIESTKLIIQK